MSLLVTMREGILAFATGVGGGAVGTYLASRSVWQVAQSHGTQINRCIDDLRDLQGLQRAPPPLPPPVASPFEVQLKAEAAAAWNSRVRGLYDFARPWVS